MEIKWHAIMVIGIFMCLAYIITSGGCDSDKKRKMIENAKIKIEIEKTKQMEIQLKLKELERDNK